MLLGTFVSRLGVDIGLRFSRVDVYLEVEFRITWHFGLTS